MLNILYHLLIIIPIIISPLSLTWATINSHIKLTTNDYQSIDKKISHTWKSYQLTKIQKIKKKPYGYMPVLLNGQDTIPSQANNFHGAISSGVDPRTGNVSIDIPLANLLYDYGKSKYTLQLSYKQGFSEKGADLLALGPHWNFNIGLEKPSNYLISGNQTTAISDGKGNSFTMIKRNNKWQLYQHKMHDVLITGNPGNWTISEAQGIRVHIKNGYEDWEEMRDGSRLWFYYNHSGSQDIIRHLRYICDNPIEQFKVNSNINACPSGIQITYDQNNITVHGTQNIKINFVNLGNIMVVKSISMPSMTTNSQQPSLIIFDYDQGKYPWLIHDIIKPTGAQTIFKYNGESDRATEHFDGLPTGINGAKIPVVTEEIFKAPPEYQQIIPDKKEWYRYSADLNDMHNFSGYQNGVSGIPGKDNLMDRDDNYEYTVQKDDGITTISTTYNKYHLALSVTQIDDNHQTIISKELMKYSNWKNTIFSQLPPQYSLVKIKTDLSYNIFDGQQNNPIKLLDKKKYNDNGQVIWEQDGYGRQKYIQYCPPHGDKNCPAMDENWPQVGLPEKIIQIPARNKFLGMSNFEHFVTEHESDPSVEIEYHYIHVPREQRLVDKINQYAKILANQNHSKSLQIQNIGIDNSINVGTILINCKTVGTLTNTQEMNLSPSVSNLPSINQSEIASKTYYNYDLNQASLTYGEIVGLHIKRFISDAPYINKIDNRLLDLRNEQNGDSGNIPNDATFYLIKKIDPKNGIRTVTTEALPHTSVASIKGAEQLLKQNKNLGLPLNSKIQSLKDGSLISSTDAMKKINNSWQYDKWGRPILETIKIKDNVSQCIHWQYIINNHQDSIIKKLPNGTFEKTDLVNLNNQYLPVNVWFSNSKDSKNIQWIKEQSYTYSMNGKIASNTEYHLDDNGSTIPLTTYFGYDLMNRNVWIKYPNGVVNLNLRDDTQLLTVNYHVAFGLRKPKLPPQFGVQFQVNRLNLLGNPVAMYAFSTYPNMKINGKYEYSLSLQKQLLELKKQLKPLSSLTTMNSYGLLPSTGNNDLFTFINNAIAQHAWISKKTIDYDGKGKKIQQTDALGNVSRYIWKNGNIIATEMANGTIIHDTYNLFGKIVTICMQPRGTNNCHVLGRHHYNYMGKADWSINEFGNRENKTYNLDGKIISAKNIDSQGNQLGAKINYIYNNYNKITKILVNGNPYINYTYDSVTWKITDIEDHIAHIHYEYNNAGQISKIIRSIPKTLKTIAGINYPIGIQIYHYDNFNKIISFTNMEGDTFFSKHDILGRKIANYVLLPNCKQPILLKKIIWDNYFNRPVSIESGNGIIRTLTYNKFGKIKQITDNLHHLIVMQLSYIYDILTGNIVQYTRAENNHSATENFTYDKHDNLTGMQCNATDKPKEADILCPHDTNLTGSSLTQPPIIMNQQYKFDNWNNISKITESSHTANNNLTKIIAYGYDYGLSGHKYYDPHQLIALGIKWNNNDLKITPIKYNKSGEVIQDAEGNTLQYNDLSQMTKFIKKTDNQYISYTYDGFGKQIAIQNFDNQGNLLQPPLYQLYETNDFQYSGEKQKNLFNIITQYQQDIQHNWHKSVNIGDTASIIDGKITNWYAIDYKSDILAIRNLQGELIDENTYSPYGMKFNLKHQYNQQIKSFKQYLGFNGKITDDFTKYQFLGDGYRAYNPVYRHFMSHDNLSPFTIINGYGFVNNNPIMKTDPTGHYSEDAARQASEVTSGLFSILMSIAMAALCPISMIATIPTTASLIITSTVAIGASLVATAQGVVGIASGVLSIASAFHDNDASMQRLSADFNLVSGAIGIFFGGMTIGESLGGSFAGIGIFNNGLIATSGLSMTASSSLTFSNVDMQLKSKDVNLGDQKDYQHTVYILGCLATGFAFLSVLVGGFSATKMALYDLSDEARLRESIIWGKWERQARMFYTRKKGLFLMASNIDKNIDPRLQHLIVKNLPSEYMDFFIDPPAGENQGNLKMYISSVVKNPNLVEQQFNKIVLQPHFYNQAQEDFVNNPKIPYNSLKFFVENIKHPNQNAIAKANSLIAEMEANN